MSNHPEPNPNPNQKQKSGKGWYARMSDTKKAEYLERRRLARQQKKAAALTILNSTVQLSQSDATSLPSLHRVPLSNITNSNTNGMHASASRSSNSTNACKRLGGQQWYAQLSDAEKAEHLMKLRMTRHQNIDAAIEGLEPYTSPVSPGISQSDCTPFQLPTILDTPSGSSTMLNDNDSDWLHSNLSYQRQSMAAATYTHGQDSFVSNNNLIMTDFQPFMPAKQLSDSADKKRCRDRERYSLMKDHQKGAYLQKNRDYKDGKRRANRLPSQSNIAASGLNPLF